MTNDRLIEEKQARKARGLPAIFRHGGEVDRRVRAGPSHMDEWVDSVAPGEKVVGIVINVRGSGLWIRLLADAGYIHMKSFRFEEAAGNAGVMAHRATSHPFHCHRSFDCLEGCGNPAS